MAKKQKPQKIMQSTTKLREAKAGKEKDECVSEGEMVRSSCSYHEDPILDPQAFGE